MHLVVDSATGLLMQQGKVDLIVVGADRVAANGDVANKIGTYKLAGMHRSSLIVHVTCHLMIIFCLCALFYGY